MLRTRARASRSGQCDRQLSITLSRRICAIRVLTDQDGRERLGGLASIGPGCTVLICGPGYNERTVRILCNDETMYVFNEDLSSGPV